MHGHDDGTFMPTLLVLIEAAPTISKPFSKCGAFHFVSPFRDRPGLHATFEPCCEGRKSRPGTSVLLLNFNNSVSRRFLSGSDEMAISMDA
jgi:hypothetical protein